LIFIFTYFVATHSSQSLDSETGRDYTVASRPPGEPKKQSVETAETVGPMDSLGTITAGTCPADVPIRRGRSMNKAQLVESVAKNTQLTKTQIEETLNVALDIIKKSVKKGDDVTLVGFGTFCRSKRKARAGRNPQTGKEIKIPAMTVPRFRAGKEFKDVVR
jgi:DNA-binding protein HU-beta